MEKFSKININEVRYINAYDFIFYSQSLSINQFLLRRYRYFFQNLFVNIKTNYP